MKFYEKIIGLNKNAPSDELIITFSNNGFEFNKNIYLANEKTLSLNGLGGEAIRFRNSQTSIEDLGQGTLGFRGNGKVLYFDFGSGSILAPFLDLGSNSIPFKNGYFSNLLSPGNLKIEAPSDSYLKLKTGGAEMIFEQDTVALLGDLTVLGKITATGKITTKESTLNTFGDVYEAFLSPNTLSIVGARNLHEGGSFHVRLIGVEKLDDHDTVTLHYINRAQQISSDAGEFDETPSNTNIWTRYYL